MVTNFTVFGCCASRDVFNSKINVNYKDFFSIGNDAFHMSMISMMNNPVDYDNKLIETFEGEISDYNLKLIKKDLEKSYLNDLKNDKYEYMLLDTYFDVMHGVIKLNNESTFITNTRFIHQTEFFKNMHNKKIITIKNNPTEYIKLWTENCDKFFDFINNYCPNLKIILNPVRSSTTVIDKGNIYEKETYKKFIPNKCYRSILDEYILNNYDVDTLIFDKKHYLDDNYFFGAGEIHYSSSYYEDVTQQLLEMISLNNTLDETTLKTIKSLKKEVLISKLNDKIAFNNQNTIFNLIEKLNTDNQDSNNSAKKKLNSNIIKYWDTILDNGYNKYYNLLNKYMLARLDIKNFGNSNNNLNLLEISDSNSLVLYPKWLKNNKGSGMIIQSDKGYLKMKLKCVNNGELNIFLKGPDIKDKQKNRYPIYIDYTSLKINGKEYIHENLLTWMEKSYKFIRTVENSEILDIELKWMPLNSSRIL